MTLSLKRRIEQVSLMKLVQFFARLFLLWLVSIFLLNLLMEILPGDAATSKVGRYGVDAVRELQIQMGLDRPFFERFSDWLFSFLRGDLGTSLVTEKPVIEIIKVPFISSLALSVIVVIALVFITIPLAVYSGAYKNLISNFFTKLAVVLSALPEFVVTILIIMVLAMDLGILPVLSLPGPGLSVFDNPICLIMPALCLWLICSAAIFRYIRVMVETYSDTSFIREAKLTGMSKVRVLFIHLLPSALPGIAQIMASTIPYLLGGSMLVETLTSYPGIGYTLIQSVKARETPIVMAVGSILIALTITFYYLADYLGRKNSRGNLS